MLSGSTVSGRGAFPFSLLFSLPDQSHELLLFLLRLSIVFLYVNFHRAWWEKKSQKESDRSVASSGPAWSLASPKTKLWLIFRSETVPDSSLSKLAPVCCRHEKHPEVKLCFRHVWAPITDHTRRAQHRHCGDGKPLYFIKILRLAPMTGEVKTSQLCGKLKTHQIP